jgi:hypothetical protein
MSAEVKSEIQLLDVVALTEAFGSLAKGSLGTVVEVLSDDAFMVEFIDDHGYTLAIETLRRDCLRKVWSGSKTVAKQNRGFAR